MVFVGKNNAGKSNLMKALDVFFGRKPETEDFRLEGKSRQTTTTISVTFIDLSPEELKLYKAQTQYPNTPKEQLTLKQTLVYGAKIEVQYEYAQDLIQLTTPAAKSRYGFLLNPELTSKSKIDSDPNVPEEYRTFLATFLEKRTATGQSKRLSNDLLKVINQAYIASNPTLRTLPTKKIFSPLKISKTNPQKNLGTYFFIPAVQDIDDETTYKAKGKTNINLLMNYILD